mgnify:CR=1 FL=1
MARVLVIEDESNISLVMEIAISEGGHEVVTAPNGRAGLELLKQSPAPDIIFVDLCLPGLSGRVVAETIHADKRMRDIPVVIITGFTPNSDNFPPPDCYRAILNKPFDLLDVLDLIERLTVPEKEKPAAFCPPVYLAGSL